METRSVVVLAFASLTGAVVGGLIAITIGAVHMKHTGITETKPRPIQEDCREQLHGIAEGSVWVPSTKEENGTQIFAQPKDPRILGWVVLDSDRAQKYELEMKVHYKNITAIEVLGLISKTRIQYSDSEFFGFKSDPILEEKPEEEEERKKDGGHKNQNDTDGVGDSRGN